MSVPAQPDPSSAPAPRPSVMARVKTRFLGWSERLRKGARGLAMASVGTLALFSAIYPKARSVPAPFNLLLLLAFVGITASPLLALVGRLLGVGLGLRSEVSASAEGLRVMRGERRRDVPASAIRVAVVLPRRRGAELRLTLTSGDELALRVDTLEEAEALLAALELDADLRRTEVAWNPLAARVGAGTLAFVLTACAFGGLVSAVHDSHLNVPAAFLMMVVPFLASGAAARALRRFVSIGRDGLALRRPYTALQTVDFDAITDVRHEADRVVLVHAGGEATHVVLTGLEPPLARLLRERIESARARFVERVGSRAQAFARGGRDLDAWKAELSALLVRAQGFRGPALGREDARRVLEDPNADPEARVGAALALMATGDEQEQRRVRVAAETSINPRVRVALEAAAEGDVEEELLEAAVGEREAAR